MRHDKVTGSLCQFLIGNVYQLKAQISVYISRMCQFLISNIYHELMGIMKLTMEDKCQFLIGNIYLYMKKILTSFKRCQFLIGNIYQPVLSVSIYDTTPFSSQNQSTMFKKSVDL